MYIFFFFYQLFGNFNKRNDDKKKIYLTQARDKEIRRVLTRLQTARRSIDRSVFNAIPDLMEGGG